MQSLHPSSFPSNEGSGLMFSCRGSGYWSLSGRKTHGCRCSGCYSGLAKNNFWSYSGSERSSCGCCGSCCCCVVCSCGSCDYFSAYSCASCFYCSAACSCGYYGNYYYSVEYRFGCYGSCGCLCRSCGCCWANKSGCYADCCSGYCGRRSGCYHRTFRHRGQYCYSCGGW